jgi:hypothetical protein
METQLPNNPPITQTAKSTSKLLIIIITLVVIAVMLGIGIYLKYYTNSAKNEQTLQNTPTPTSEAKNDTTITDPTFTEAHPVVTEISNSFMVQSVAFDAKFISGAQSSITLKGLDAKEYQYGLKSSIKFYKVTIESGKEKQTEIKISDIPKDANITAYASLGTERVMKIQSITYYPK